MKLAKILNKLPTRPRQLSVWLGWIFLIGLLLVVGTFGLYFAFLGDFGRESFTDRTNVWGEFGDFIGGTLNPILTFLSLIALLLTLAVQLRQVAISRRALKLSNTELRDTREVLMQQAELLRESAEHQKHLVNATWEWVRIQREATRPMLIVDQLSAVPIGSDTLRVSFTLINIGQPALRIYPTVLDASKIDPHHQVNLGNDYNQHYEIEFPWDVAFGIHKMSFSYIASDNFSGEETLNLHIGKAADGGLIAEVSTDRTELGSKKWTPSLAVK